MKIVSREYEPNGPAIFLVKIDDDWPNLMKRYEDGSRESAPGEGDWEWRGEGEEPTARNAIGAVFGDYEDALEFHPYDASVIAEFLCAKEVD